MDEVTLSVIVPTLGRPTLGRALDSIVGQLDERDELLVVADSAGDRRAARAEADWRQGRYLERPHDPLLGVGNAQRQAGIAAARGSHLCFLDDDDVYLPGALALFRSAAGDLPAVFRVELYNRLCWAEPVLRRDNVSGIALVVANRAGLLGEWRGWYDAGERGLRGADYVFVSGCAERAGGVVWREELVAAVGGWHGAGRLL